MDEGLRLALVSCSCLYSPSCRYKGLLGNSSHSLVILPVVRLSHASSWRGFRTRFAGK